MGVERTKVRTVFIFKLMSEWTVCLVTNLTFFYFQVTGTKVFVMPGGMMKSNGNLVDLIEKVKPEIRTLIEKCNTVSCLCMY